MLKFAIAGALFYALWGPTEPIRTVASEALYTAGDLIRR
jgi:hypothetical protein